MRIIGLIGVLITVVLSPARADQPADGAVPTASGVPQEQPGQVRITNAGWTPEALKALAEAYRQARTGVPVEVKGGSVRPVSYTHLRAHET